MVKASVIVVLSFIASGCAVNPHSMVAVETDAQVVCKMEKPTGSNRPVKICRPVGGVLDQEETKRDMGVLQRQSEILSNPN